MPRQISPLATPEQAEVERTALRLLQRPEVQQSRAAARLEFQADSLARIPAAEKTLEQGVDECVLAAIYDTILNDRSTPRILWIETPPHRWFGHGIGGARYFNDNPDCPTRAACLDPLGVYEIQGRARKVRQAALSFQLYPDNTYGLVLPGLPPRSSPQARFDTPLGGLFDEGLAVAADGSYRITLSPEPARGRVNHIQTREDGPALLIRSVLSDWSTQAPDALTIRRLDRPASAERLSDADLAAQVVRRLQSDVPFWLKANHFFVLDNPPNRLPTPQARGGGWGYSSFGNYRLGADEALLITIHPMGARYTGFVVTTPWSISCEHVHRSGSLNNTQTHANPDGSYTYVISATDPGVANWLDTSGLDAGGYFVRWMKFPELPPTGEGLVRETRLVRLADLERILPRDVPKLTPGQRVAELAKRARAFERRLACPLPSVSESGEQHEDRDR